jgi:Icc-related predicted phosphoesterase
MRIVHFSDWHGAYVDLPPADLYVCTGDMNRNFPIFERGMGLRLFRIVPEHERSTQELWMSRPQNQMRSRLGSPDSPVVCVRGNHDFAPIAPIFAGCAVTELVDNEVHEVLGLRVTGHRGIPFIFGTWNDEVQRPDLVDRMRAMPHADLYVTHYPPMGVLDDRRSRYGLEGMANLLVMRHDGRRAAHLFGHIHEDGGRVEQHGDVTFSNAATKYNVIDL